MKNTDNHIFITEMKNERNYCIDINSLLTDIKVLLKEYYLATFNEDGNQLLLKFSNGQKFKLTLSEFN